MSAQAILGLLLLKSVRGRWLVQRAFEVWVAELKADGKEHEPEYLAYLGSGGATRDPEAVVFALLTANGAAAKANGLDRSDTAGIRLMLSGAEDWLNGGEAMPRADEQNNTDTPTERRTLDDKGRCCGRKPLGNYWHPPQGFCFRCGRSYSLDTGEQIQNWFWQRLPDGTFARVRRMTEAARA